MTRERRFRPRGPGWDSYLDLVLVFPLASIRSESHRGEAQRVMDNLLARDRLDAGEVVYLDALSDLVAAYEDVHHPIGPASDADMLRHFLEARGMTQAELGRAAGISRSTISEVLSGKRPFSRGMIRKLAGAFHVDVSVLAANL